MENWPGWGKTPNARHPLDEKHPDIEWSIEEKSEFNTRFGEKNSRYHWTVANKLTKKQLTGVADYPGTAKKAVANAANYLLTHDLTWSKTDPCVICDKPSRVGTATCSHAHDLILEKVKMELVSEPV